MQGNLDLWENLWPKNTAVILSSIHPSIFPLVQGPIGGGDNIKDMNQLLWFLISYACLFEQRPTYRAVKETHQGEWDHCLFKAQWIHTDFDLSHDVEITNMKSTISLTAIVFFFILWEKHVQSHMDIECP